MAPISYALDSLQGDLNVPSAHLLPAIAVIRKSLDAMTNLSVCSYGHSKRRQQKIWAFFRMLRASTSYNHPPQVQIKLAIRCAQIEQNRTY